MTPHAEDVATLDLLRRELEAAENASDAEAIAVHLADDVAFMVPHAPVREGKTASISFVRDVLSDLSSYYNRRIAYASAEIRVDADTAFDRGTFTVDIEKKDGADPGRFSGKYLWTYARTAGTGWKLSRVIVSLDQEPEEEACAEGATRAAETIETTRLILRRPEPRDVDAIFKGFASNAAVTRYVGWPRHTSRAATEGFIRFSDAEWARGSAGPYLVASRDTGELLGCTGLSFETPYRASTGYVLDPSAWGRGYATEALAAMVDLARAHGVRRLYAIVHPDHHTSMRVLAKCGFTREALLARYIVFPNLSPEPADVLIYTRVF